MYTYVFEDRENEVALNSIKALIFDIIASEKAKQAIAREKVINSGDSNLQQAFLSLTSQQDEVLDSFLFVGNQLGEVLKKVDSYSRELSYLDGNNMALPVNEAGVVNAPINDMVANVPVNNETVISDNSRDMINNHNNAVIPVEEESTNNGAPVFSSEDAVKDDSIDNLVSSPVIDDTPDSDEVVQENSEVKEDILNKDASVESTTSNEGVSGDNATVSEEKAGEEPLENAGVKLVIPGASTSSEEKKEDNEAHEEVSSGPLIIPSVNSEENDSSKLVIPSGDASEVKNEESAPVTIKNNPPQIIPDVNSDPALDALLSSDPTPKEDTPVLTFKKRSEILARAILTSSKQITKLRSSLSTQEALLSSRGFFENIGSVNDANLEQKLVDNGLLPGDSQAQIEQMMSQANELYAAGKVEEAQAMYDKISELNKQIQGGAAMAA